MRRAAPGKRLRGDHAMHAPVGRGFSKNDIGESRNGMARPGDRTKLPPVDSFDYIIIGAGTAGCVLADRLSASGRDRVLVLEAGGSDSRFWIKAPIGYGFTFADPRSTGSIKRSRVPGLNGRTMYWPRGRVIGGSSSINALVYCRGMPADFDDWRDLGKRVGAAAMCCPISRGPSGASIRAAARATQGPLDVKDVTPFLHPMRRQWLDAAARIGPAGDRGLQRRASRGVRLLSACRSATAGGGRRPTRFCAPHFAAAT